MNIQSIAVVTTTIGSAEKAKSLAQEAVGAKLAACAQIEAITSLYVWQGEPTQEAEWRVIFKTLPDGISALHCWLQQVHPYEVPQILTRVEDANASYAIWVAASMHQ